MPLEHLGNPPVASDRQPRPFSPAVRAGDFVYVSGQVPANAAGEIVGGGIEAQTRQVFDNLKAVLALAGCTLDDVCKATVGWTTRATSARSTASTWSSSAATSRRARPPRRA